MNRKTLIIVWLLFSSFHAVARQPLETVCTYAKQFLYEGASCVPVFSRLHDVQALLIGLIALATKPIRTAQFLFTDEVIADALCVAHVDQCDVEVVCDAVGAGKPHSQVPILLETGIPTYRLCGKEGAGLMHHKFWLFERVGGVPDVVLAGSYNLTLSARNKNYEHAVLLQGAEVAQRFKEEFEELKACSPDMP